MIHNRYIVVRYSDDSTVSANIQGSTSELVNMVISVISAAFMGFCDASKGDSQEEKLSNAEALLQRILKLGIIDGKDKLRKAASVSESEVE